jgi:hypothetical protein
MGVPVGVRSGATALPPRQGSLGIGHTLVEALDLDGDMPDADVAHFPLYRRQHPGM